MTILTLSNRGLNIGSSSMLCVQPSWHSVHLNLCNNLFRPFGLDLESTLFGCAPTSGTPILTHLCADDVDGPAWLVASAALIYNRLKSIMFNSVLSPFIQQFCGLPRIQAIHHIERAIIQQQYRTIGRIWLRFFFKL